MDELGQEKKVVKIVDNFLSRNPDNETVLDVLETNAAEAARALSGLLYSENENVKLSAARDILDRTGWKPVERKDVTSGGMPISAGPLLTDEQLTDIVNGFIKRSAIDVPGKEVRTPEGNLPPGS